MASKPHWAANSSSSMKSLYMWWARRGSKRDEWMSTQTEGWESRKSSGSSVYGIRWNHMNFMACLPGAWTGVDHLLGWFGNRAVSAASRFAVGETGGGGAAGGSAISHIGRGGRHQARSGVCGAIRLAFLCA